MGQLNLTRQSLSCAEENESTVKQVIMHVDQCHVIGISRQSPGTLAMQRTRDEQM